MSREERATTYYSLWVLPEMSEDARNIGEQADRNKTPMMFSTLAGSRLAICELLVKRVQARTAPEHRLRAQKHGSFEKEGNYGDSRGNGSKHRKLR
jgi:hypothetical protein